MAPTSAQVAGHSLILYDGVCGLCNRFVQFVLRHDARGRFWFCALQDPLAGRILASHGLDSASLGTFCLVNMAYSSRREGAGAIQRRCGCSAGTGRVVAFSGQSALFRSPAYSRPWLPDCGESSIWDFRKTGCLPPAECPAARPIPRIQLTFAVGLGLHSAKLTFRPTNPTAGLRISGSLLRGHFEGRYPTCTTETPCQN